MKLPRNLRPLGFTLLEMMVSIGCGSIMLAAVMTAGVALQRSFMAVEGYSLAEGDQLRVQDYIAMDCRRCRTVAVANNTLTLTLPKYYQANGTPYDANSTTADQSINYGSGTVTISYYQSGSNFVRNVDGVEQAIATNVSGFTVLPQDLTSSVSCTITFSPRFVYLPGPGPINGTTVYSNTFLRNASARN
jgi:hypothetical protein